MKGSLFLIILIISTSSFAQTRKIKELERQRKETLLEISNTDKLLRETKKSTSTLLSRIKLVSNQIASRKKVVSLLEQEVESIGVEQVNIEAGIKELEAELKNKQSNYATAVDAVLRNRNSDNRLLFILSGRSLSESYRRLKYLRSYSEQRSSQADEIKGKQLELRQKKDALIQTRAEKIALLKQREIEQENLKKEESTYQADVKDAQQKQSELQKILTQKIRQRDNLNKQIEKLIAEDIARQEREAKKREAERAKAKANSRTKNNTKNKGKDKNNTKSKSNSKEVARVEEVTTEASSEDVRLSGTFAANKGKLPIPVTGAYSITTRFGAHQHQQWKSVTTMSNGIDVRSRSGASARAVFDGEVTLVVASPGYNNCIIVRHGNYYTFYGNIITLSVKKGDRVKTNQVLGRIFTDPDTGASELHFQLWKGTTKLNPEPWLKK